MVKVIIERRVKAGTEAQLEKLLIEMRTHAMQYSHNFISGEVLTAVDDPSVRVIIGTFLDYDSWKQWEESPARKRVLRRIKPFLASEPKVAVYIARP